MSMSVADSTLTAPASYVLRLRQLFAITRIEIYKILFSRRSTVAYVLALIPVVLLVLIQFNGFTKADTGIDYARRMYAYIYSGFILGVLIFLGSASIFTALFRGEILNCSIHYYLLTPVRREILVLGKYLGGLISAWLLFGISTVIGYLLIYLPYGFSRLFIDMTNGIVLTQIFTYLGISLLGCVGYGSLFMATGLIFRNPVIPIIVIAGWEFIHFVLPPALKFFSVVHYLKGLLPIPLNEGPLAIVVSPPSLWVSVFSIIILAFISLLITFLRLNRFEVKYTED